MVGKNIIVVLIVVFAALSLITAIPLLELVSINAKFSIYAFGVVMAFFLFVGATVASIAMLIDKSSHATARKVVTFMGANPYQTARYYFAFIAMMLIALLFAVLEIVSVFIRLPFYSPSGLYVLVPILLFLVIGLFCRWSYKNAVSEAIKAGIMQKEDYMSALNAFKVLIAIMAILIVIIFAIQAAIIFSAFAAA